MDNSGSSNTTQNMSIAGAMLAYRLHIEMVTSISVNFLFLSDLYRKLEENLLPLKTKKLRDQMSGSCCLIRTNNLC